MHSAAHDPPTPCALSQCSCRQERSQKMSLSSRFCTFSRSFCNLPGMKKKAPKLVANKRKNGFVTKQPSQVRKILMQHGTLCSTATLWGTLAMSTGAGGCGQTWVATTEGSRPLYPQRFPGPACVAVRHTVAVHVEGPYGVRAHDGLRQRIVGLQEPRVVLLE